MLWVESHFYVPEMGTMKFLGDGTGMLRSSVLVTGLSEGDLQHEEDGSSLPLSGDPSLPRSVPPDAVALPFYGMLMDCLL